MRNIFSNKCFIELLILNKLYRYEHLVSKKIVFFWVSLDVKICRKKNYIILLSRKKLVFTETNKRIKASHDKNGETSMSKKVPVSLGSILDQIIKEVMASEMAEIIEEVRSS